MWISIVTEKWDPTKIAPPYCRDITFIRIKGHTEKQETRQNKDNIFILKKDITFIDIKGHIEKQETRQNRDRIFQL